jgi:hypothetical protein
MALNSEAGGSTPIGFHSLSKPETICFPTSIDALKTD